MRPRLTQLSLAVIIESTNIILVYCPPSRGLIFLHSRTVRKLELLPPIAGIDIRFALRKYIAIAIAPPLRGLIPALRHSVRIRCLLPPLRGLILHAASGQLLNGGTPSTLFHPPSTPPLCVPLPTFRSGEAASAIRKRLQKNIFDSTVAPPRKNDIMCMNEKN